MSKRELWAIVVSVCLTIGGLWYVLPNPKEYDKNIARVLDAFNNDRTLVYVNLEISKGSGWKLARKNDSIRDDIFVKESVYVSVPDIANSKYKIDDIKNLKK
jgi:hypothetical protein